MASQGKAGGYRPGFQFTSVAGVTLASTITTRVVAPIECKINRATSLITTSSVSDAAVITVTNATASGSGTFSVAVGVTNAAQATALSSDVHCSAGDVITMVSDGIPSEGLATLTLYAVNETK